MVVDFSDILFNMTLSEAFSPHSMDTPIMVLIGFSLLFGICAYF
jgi:hypothetical protein